MPTYKAPVEDVKFLLNDVFHMERYGNMPGFSDASPDVVAAILDEAAKFSEEVLQPLNRTGDLEGCKRNDDGSVTTPKGFKEAYRQMIDGGWVGISVPTEYGGQGLPATMTMIVNEMLAHRTWPSRCIRDSRRARSRRCCTTPPTSRRRPICRR